jgi:hypothetical protein
MKLKTIGGIALAALIATISAAEAKQAVPQNLNTGARKTNILNVFRCTPTGAVDGIAGFINVNHVLALQLFTPQAGNSIVGGEIGPGNLGDFTSFSETIEGSDTCNGPFIFLTGTASGVAKTIYALQPQGTGGPINVTFHLSDFRNSDGSVFTGTQFTVNRVDLVTYPSADQIYGSFTYNMYLNGQPVGFNTRINYGANVCPSNIPTTPPPCAF